MKSGILGSLIFLSGISLIGFIWFKRNKVTIGQKQLDEISKKSASINSIDKPFEYSKNIINNSVKNPYSSTSISDKDQELIRKEVETIDCDLGLAWASGVDCTNYNIRQQQLNNPSNINTTNCVTPKLFITNVRRVDSFDDKRNVNTSLWKISYSVCGVDYKKRLPISFETIIIDSVGSQKNELKGTYIIYQTKSNDGFLNPTLDRRPKSAVITIIVKFDDGKSLTQTYNYKE